MHPRCSLINQDTKQRLVEFNLEDLPCDPGLRSRISVPTKNLYQISVPTKQGLVEFNLEDLPILMTKIVSVNHKFLQTLLSGKLRRFNPFWVVTY